MTVIFLIIFILFTLLLDKRMEIIFYFTDKNLVEVERMDISFMYLYQIFIELFTDTIFSYGIILFKFLNTLCSLYRIP